MGFTLNKPDDSSSENVSAKYVNAGTKTGTYGQSSKNKQESDEASDISSVQMSEEHKSNLKVSDDHLTVSQTASVQSSRKSNYHPDGDCTKNLKVVQKAFNIKSAFGITGQMAMDDLSMDMDK